MKNILKKGFTLIELLIVIAIIGILAGLILTNLVGARERARDSRRKADLDAVSTSLRLYYNDTAGFPASLSWGSALTNPTLATTIYMNYLPYDPISTATSNVPYQYYPSGTDAFLLVAQLENASDPDIATSQSRCAQLYGSLVSSKDLAHDYLSCTQ